MSEPLPKDDLDALVDELSLRTEPGNTLHGIARKTYWSEGLPLPSDKEVTAALMAAGIDPADEKERERFLSIVRHAAHFRDSEYVHPEWVEETGD